VTSNDEQIEVLIRRFAATAAGPNGGGSHLDADEMNAFAEGVLPAASRSHYVSHLAECDQCRRQVADLAIASGAITRAEQTVVDKPVRAGLWASLAGLFALPVLRYAALAVFLVAVGGVAFFALRPRSESPVSLVARNEGDQPQPSSAVKPATDSNGGLANSSGALGQSPTSSPAPAATQPPTSQPPKGLTNEQDELRPNDTTTTAPVPMKEIAKAPEVAEKKAEEPMVAGRLPYSPAPPGETQSVTRVQTQTGGNTGAPGGPKQQQQAAQSMDKAAQVDRERDAAKDARLDDANRNSDQPVLAARRANDEKSKGGPSRNMDNIASNNRSSNEVVRGETPKTESRKSGEDNSETRSAGGHKFRRQGNAWVDQKFKSSLSIKNVSRGSDEFSSLDSGLRSIAQQLSGEVIVVWKGKAYLIK
jgi:hypothetical protein